MYFALNPCDAAHYGTIPVYDKDNFLDAHIVVSLVDWTGIKLEEFETPIFSKGDSFNVYSARYREIKIA